MAIVAYVRSSTEAQNNEYQISAIKQHNVDKWFIEKQSGRSTNRPKLRAMLEWVREGDTVLVYDWSRMSRSLKDLLGIIDTLAAKHVALVSLKEGTIDDSASGRLVVQIMGAVAEWQVNVQHEKALEGIAIAKSEGKYLGRRPIKVEKDVWDDLRAKWQTRQITKAEWARQLGVSRPTLDKLIAKDDNGENIFR